MVVLYFLLIALMRVVQVFSNKKTSNMINNSKTFFAYGSYYQFMSAVFSVIMLCSVGFYGFDTITVICSLVSALLFAVELFACLEAMKGTKLVICNIFNMGGLFVPCLLGIFLFSEPMSVWQWVGLAVFILSTALLVSDKDKGKKMTLKTLIMLIIVFLANGFVMVVQKYFALKVPNGNVAMFSFLTFGFNAVMLFAVYSVLKLIPNKQEEKSPLFKELNGKLYIYGTILAIALFTINVLVTMLSKTIDSVILFPTSAGITILVTLLVGIIVFNEKLTLKNVIGMTFSLASIIIINLL